MEEVRTGLFRWERWMRLGLCKPLCWPGQARVVPEEAKPKEWTCRPLCPAGWLVGRPG